MTPRLKISNLTNLQDARYSAALGFHYVSFNLERGHPKKLAPNLIWNMANWLEGPGLILELNAFSLEELPPVQKTTEVSYISLPMEDWNELVFQTFPRVMLRMTANEDSSRLLAMAEAARDDEFELKFECFLQPSDEPRTLAPLLPHCLLHFPSLESSLEFLQTTPPAELPWGIALGAEAEEEPGMLDYEAIDAWMEAFTERFVEA